MRPSTVAARTRKPLVCVIVCLVCVQSLAFAPGRSALAFPPLKHTPRRVEVKIEDLKFKPAEIEVGPGDTVAWVNDDDTEHGVKADDGSFNSGHLATGRTFEHKFEKPGKFIYHDELHPRMHGTVTVVDK